MHSRDPLFPFNWRSNEMSTAAVAAAHEITGPIAAFTCKQMHLISERGTRGEYYLAPRLYPGPFEPGERFFCGFDWRAASLRGAQRRKAIPAPVTRDVATPGIPGWRAFAKRETNDGKDALPELGSISKSDCGLPALSWNVSFVLPSPSTAVMRATGVRGAEFSATCTQ